MSYRLSARKASREYGWSLLIVVILAVGFTTWITIPSVSYSMNNALSTYANDASTYIVISSPVSAVSGLGGSPVFSVLPGSLINQMRQISGVQSVYPMVVNFTTITIHNYYLNLTIQNENKTINNPNATLYINVESAIIGGPLGFPIALVHPVSGRAPTQGEGAFMLESGFGASTQNKYFQVNSTFTLSVASKNFTAQYVGQNEASPLFSTITVLLDPSFLQEQLGSAVYNQTFGGANGSDYVIIKTNSIDDVTSVVSRLQTILANSSAASSGNFQVIYDQAAIIDLESIKSGTMAMYFLVGAFSLVLAVSLMFVVSYVGFKRRGWEVGLLLSQGWSWKGVYRYMLYYFLILSGLSTILAIALSFALLSRLSYTFQVYGSKLVVVAAPQVPFILITLPIVLVLSFVSPRFAVSRLRKQGLDSILREY